MTSPRVKTTLHAYSHTLSLPDVSTDAGKHYHKARTGQALSTVNQHQAAKDITLFGSCFCPFVQRVWVALEFFEIPYQYYEVDPYKKPPDLLQVSPKGLVRIEIEQLDCSG
ncbi:hypothetical protein E4T56_gene18067 [Termitomyces sp. T112]|nr:hypothetical protein E4T56_gene18067 [Termitomyces sp. T112]